jgi:site-specific recombinase XerD
LFAQHQMTGTRERVFDLLPNVKWKGEASNTRIAKICKKANLRRIHNHVLRHTFASHAVMHGISIRVVQQWLGHSKIEMTERYTHVIEAHEDEMIQRLSGRRRPPGAVDTLQHRLQTSST